MVKGRRRAGSPLWAKAPFALVQYPGLLAAVVVGALLLSLVAAAFPLFLSRSESELLRAEIANPTVGRFGAGLFYSVTNVGFGEPVREGDDRLLTEALDEAFGRIAARGPHLGSPIRFVSGATAQVTLPDGTSPESGRVEGTIFSGTEAEDQVRVVSGGAEDGALVPDLIADALEVEPGDTIRLDGKLDLRVAGTYEALYSQPRSGYWSPWSEQIYPQCFDCPAPPQYILVGPEEAISLSRALREGDQQDVDHGWVAPVTGMPLDADEAREVRAYTERVTARAAERGTRLGRLFQCCGQTFGGSFFFGRRDVEFRSGMPSVLRSVERRAAAVEGPLRLLLIAGLGVAGAVVAAAAAFAVAGRRTEAALLHARGWGPVRFAARSAVESAIPIALGAAVGLAAAWVLIAWLGPPAPAAAAAQAASVTAAAAAAAASLAILGVVTAVSFIRAFEVHALKRRLAWVPWELLVIAGALWVLSRLRAGGAVIEDPALDISRPSSLLLAFPVLLVAGFAILGARLLVAMLRRAGSGLGRSSPAPYLAVHRLTGLPGLTVLLMGASALCLGVFVNGQTMVGSLRATVDAKAGVFVGADVQVSIDYAAPEQERFPLPITRATRLKYAGELLPSGTPFDILGVDAATIADAAYWDDSFADRSLEDLAAGLASDSGPLPAVLVQGGGEPTAIRTAQAEIPIEVVGRADAFPGVSSDDPVVVVDAHSLEERVDVQGNPFHSPNARTEYWIAGDPQEALAAVADLEAYPLGTLTLEEVKDVPFIKAAIETFSMLNVLGLGAALLVVGVLVVYLQARQRARAVSNILSLRMGMRVAQARLALALELGAILISSFVIGASLGLVAGRLVAPLLDPLQTIPPAPLFDAPLGVLVWTAIGLVVVAAVGAWLVQRRASAVDLGEVLRVAE
ncbi:MAG TPA: ABC transporter permease [Actinomycetota bacterium]|nr:ABC transporter permease [Actinomycetota bacterium]